MAAALGVVAEAANARLLQERIDRAREQIAALQERAGRLDTLAETLRELPKGLSHPVMVPLGKRAMVPGKIVRSNEVLAHLGDDYYAWRSASSAVEIIGHLRTRVREEEAALKQLSDKRADVDRMSSLRKMYEAEGIREIQETVEESERGAVPVASEKDIEELFEIEEAERRERERAAWDWDDVMKRMEELEAAEALGDSEESLEDKREAPEQQAAALKAEGNAAFARREFQAAVTLYSQALALEPASHVLFANRSAAYHRCKRYDRALEDATAAIRLDASWVKGHYRQASALAALGRFDEAARAFDRAATLCPTDMSLVDKAASMRAKAADATAADAKAADAKQAATGSQQAPPAPAARSPAARATSFVAPVVSARGEAPFPTASPSPPPLSSSAAFSGSIMERGVLERPAPAASAFGTGPRTSRFAGNNPGGDRVTLEPVGEAQPVKRVSRFRAARAAAHQQ